MNNTNIAVAIYGGDWADWELSLKEIADNQKQDAKIFLLGGDFHPVPPTTIKLAEQAFAQVNVFRTQFDFREFMGQRSLWEMAGHIFETHKQVGPVLYLARSIKPLIPNWLNTIEHEYLQSGKTFLGIDTKIVFRGKEELAPISALVAPGNWVHNNLTPELRGLEPMENPLIEPAFVRLRYEILREMARTTRFGSELFGVNPGWSFYVNTPSSTSAGPQRTNIGGTPRYDYKSFIGWINSRGFIAIDPILASETIRQGVENNHLLLELYADDQANKDMAEKLNQQAQQTLSVEFASARKIPRAPYTKKAVA